MNTAPRPVTIVTGASRGIGEAVARRLAADGHDLVLSYRERAESAELVAEACRRTGARALLVRLDLAELDGVAGLVPAALAEFGRIDHLVNNAGITGRIGEFLDVDPVESEAVFRINVLAPMLLAQTAIAHFVETGTRGSIVNVSSGAATSGAPHLYVPYAMSKAALNAMTIGLAKEFGPAGIRVNTVSPGTTRTEIHALAGRPNAPEERAPNIPLRRAGEPEEVAAAVAYLLSPEASYTSGADIRVTGGN